MIPAILAIAIAQVTGAPTTPIPEPKPKPKAATPRRRTKPRVQIQQPKPKPQTPQPKPFALTYTDKPTGYGLPSKVGDIVTIQFLVKRKDGVDLADSKKRGLPYTFKIGEAGNDPLFDLVVKGMKIGAVRTATLQGKDAYGQAGAPPSILPTDTLTVTVTLLRRGDK